MEDSLSFVKSGEQGDVNLYCGCAVLLFAGMYFFNKEIRIVEKIVLGLLIVLYFAGFHVTMLNLLFHGCISRWEFLTDLLLFWCSCF